MPGQNTGLTFAMQSHLATPNGSVRIYRVAKRRAGQHLTLDDSVNHKEGCGESVSAILLEAGVPEVPAKGFKGTIGLNAFLMDNPQVEEIVDPEPGAIIVSVAAGNREGHTGIFADFNAAYPDDWTILSNDSNTG